LFSKLVSIGYAALSSLALSRSLERPSPHPCNYD